MRAEQLHQLPEPVAPFPQGVEIADRQPDPVPQDSYLSALQESIVRNSPQALVEIFSSTRVKQLSALSEIFDSNAIPPGETVTRRRVGKDVPFMGSIQVIASEMTNLTFTDTEIKAIFVQHHLSVENDEEYEAAKAEFDKDVAMAPYQAVPDRNLRYRIPTPPTTYVYESIYSRENPSSDPWTGPTPERVAAVAYHWNAEEGTLSETYLSGNALEKAIATYHQIKRDPERTEKLQNTEALYRYEIAEMMRAQDPDTQLAIAA